MKKSTIFKSLTLLLIIAAGGFIFYNKVYIPKSTYQTYTPKKGVTNVEVFGIGELEAKDIYPVGSAIGGRVIEVDSDEGKYIKKDDIIAKLDPVDLYKKLDAAKAGFKKAQFDLESTKKELLIAKQKAALAADEYHRNARVHKELSKISFKKSKTNMLTAQTQVELLARKIESMKMLLKELKYNIEGIEKRISELNIKSPINGFVIEKNVEVGQSIMPSFTVVKIVDPKTLWIKAWIDERISGKVKVGQKAKIVLRSRAKTPFDAVVKRVAPVSDPITQEREVDVAFVAPPKPFYMNEQAEVYVSVESFNGLYKIPLEYIVEHKGKKGVWIAQNGKAHFVALKIIAKDNEFAGVEKGVDENSKIIIPNPKKKPLFEGSRVRL
jgi:RND family efflux transporter MFP subunit